MASFFPFCSVRLVGIIGLRQSGAVKDTAAGIAVELVSVLACFLWLNRNEFVFPRHPRAFLCSSMIKRIFRVRDTKICCVLLRIANPLHRARLAWLFCFLPRRVSSTDCSYKFRKRDRQLSTLHSIFRSNLRATTRHKCSEQMMRFDVSEASAFCAYAYQHILPRRRAISTIEVREVPVLKRTRQTSESNIMSGFSSGAL